MNLTCAKRIFCLPLVAMLLVCVALGMGGQRKQPPQTRTKSPGSGSNSCLSGTWTGNYYNNYGEQGVLNAQLTQFGSSFNGSVTIVSASAAAASQRLPQAQNS